MLQNFNLFYYFTKEYLFVILLVYHIHYYQHYIMSTLAKNKQASFNYDIISQFEAGIVLSGQEVKSVKTGHVSLKGAFITVRGNELFLTNAFIPKYRHSSDVPGYDPTQPRKILLHRREIRSLIGKARSDGLTIIPLSVYTKGRYVKVKCAVARGKKSHDKRHAIKKRDTDRSVRRELRGRV